MPDIKGEVSLLMKAVRKKGLPSSEVIVDETFQKLGYLPGKIPPEDVQKNFDEILNQVWTETLTVLEEYESRVYPLNVIDHLMAMKNAVVNESERVAHAKEYRAGIRHLFVSLYPYLREIFLSISQSRKQRGGRDFELQFGKLLELIDVPYQKVKRAYRVDFMIPSDDAFQQNRNTAVIASAKRTLRERWQEVVAELQAMRSPNIFLVTADYDVSTGHVDEICGRYGIHLVVWKEVKKKYSTVPLVLSYTEWANERIPVFKQWW